jgi:hypothetical protein
MFDYNSNEPEYKRKIASAENTSVNVLQQLSKDSDRDIRLLVASNPNTSIQVLLKLGEEFPEAIIENPIFYLLLLEDPDSLLVRLSLARSSTTASETLEKLAQDKDELVRAGVAGNRNAPLKILNRLTKDYRISVKKAISRNPSASKEILDKIIKDKDRDICQEVGRNPITPPDILEKLASHPNNDVRDAVMKHKNASNLALAIVQYMNGKQMFLLMF